MQQQYNTLQCVALQTVSEVKPVAPFAPYSASARRPMTLLEEMSGEDETDQGQPFIEASSSSSNVIQEPPRRTGDVVSAAAHIITGVIGAGVLSLAWSMAQLGWLAGPLCILIFAAATTVSSFLLSDCYRFPLPHGPVRNPSLMHAVKLYLGGKREVACGVLVKIYLVGTSTAYVITAASSARYSSVVFNLLFISQFFF